MHLVFFGIPLCFKHKWGCRFSLTLTKDFSYLLHGLPFFSMAGGVCSEEVRTTLPDKSIISWVQCSTTEDRAGPAHPKPNRRTSGCLVFVASSRTRVRLVPRPARPARCLTKERYVESRADPTHLACHACPPGFHSQSLEDGRCGEKL